MNLVPSPRIWLPVAGMAAMLSFGFALARPAPMVIRSQPAFDARVHGRDADHDWLLVVDGKADQRVVYDRADGRLLQRVAVRRGLDDISTLAQRDGRLFVVDDDGMLDELDLP